MQQQEQLARDLVECINNGSNESIQAAVQHFKQLCQIGGRIQLEVVENLNQQNEALKLNLIKVIKEVYGEKAIDQILISQAIEKYDTVEKCLDWYLDQVNI